MLRWKDWEKEQEMEAETKNIHAVTGAFGYSGKYIAERLLAEGKEVITLTNSFQRENPFGDRLKAFPFHFDDPHKLAETLDGVSVLYNTYWVRFNHRSFTHADAVRNTLTLFQAARMAGVERVVHVSITNPTEDSPLEYFSGKAKLEQALVESGLSYAILRPTVLFGKKDILINNIAWVLRHLPVFGVFGDGQYKVQPIYVDDLARLAVEQGGDRRNRVIDAIGPETFTYRELAHCIGEIIGKRRPILSVPPSLGYLVGWVIGRLVGDVMITREEIAGLMANLLYVDSPPAGNTKLTDWAMEHASTLGLHYTSEMARRRDRQIEYRSN
jgi:NADH dehydrogenase